MPYCQLKGRRERGGELGLEETMSSSVEQEVDVSLVGTEE
jgi:hypothetical protein